MKNEVYLRIDPDEEIMETIKNVCEKENIFTAYFQGICAYGNAVLSPQCPERKGFLEHRYSGMTEVDLQWLADDFSGDAGNFCHKEEVYGKQ